MPQPVILGPAGRAAIQGGMLDVFQAASDRSSWIDQVFEERSIASDRQTIVIPEDVDRMHRWDEGVAPDRDNFRFISFAVTAHKWGLEVPIRRVDVEDDQVNEVLAAARRVMGLAPQLKEEVLIQVLRTGTDPTLLPSVPNAADGVAYYSATDADSNNRFGVAGGNIQTGTGIATGAAVRNDYLDGISRLQRFRNTKGNPVHGPLRRFGVIYGTHLQRVFWQAFLQERGPGGTNAQNAGETNLAADADVLPVLWSTPFLDNTDDWFIFALDAPRSLVSGQRRALEELLVDNTMSDEARTLDLNILCTNMRWGIGLGVPFDTVAVDNGVAGVGT